jgi:hypothetical protein
MCGLLTVILPPTYTSESISPLLFHLPPIVLTAPVEMLTCLMVGNPSLIPDESNAGSPQSPIRANFPSLEIAMELG